MKRLFKDHYKRNVTELSGAWRFATDPDCIGESEGWQNGLPNGDIVIVPSVWNNELGLLNFEGCGWYEKKFTTEGGTLLFEFESVMTAATVWLDGKMLGEHYGAFTQFELIANDVSCGEHILIVRADNRIDKKSFPQRYTDWFNYGGIARDVFAHKLKDACILNNHIVYELSEDLSSANVCAELELYNASSSPVTSCVSVKIGDSVIYNDNVTLDGYSKSSLKTPLVTLDNIAIWDTASPNLYTVVASTDTDDLIDKIGFRKIEVKNGDILLNGHSIELLGVNRHEEHPDWGFAFPPKLMKKDIDLMLDMGCNTVRGSHYPNSKIFVDMLDERGILFWSEIPMWGCGFSEQSLQDPVIVERGYNMHKEMVKCYYNHPSIIIWGMHNEIATYSEHTYPISKQWSKFLRENGGNRLITHASCHPLLDNDMDFDDIICINIYHGWYTYRGYNGNLSDWNKMIEEFRARRSEKGWENKPVIMSEFGAAALMGFHSHFDTVRWSEEYQRDLIEYCLELFHNTDYMRGTYIWQFCNIRTSHSMDLNRVRYFNNKGILDEYRNPKASYFKIKELYHKFAKNG
ncbi:MAG: beta-glucuronidase [Clostridia bacterium]|nr:beta-glucuronidase [Clostridia bacterium]MBO5416062.1 beta-glucuronidase [Clostridia bacterium]